VFQRLLTSSHQWYCRLGLLGLSWGNKTQPLLMGEATQRLDHLTLQGSGLDRAYMSPLCSLLPYANLAELS
jgi:hypothetical protein